jgi:tripeptide aminopeptidase
MKHEPKLETLLSLLRQICETPAPTFAEQRRAALLADLLGKSGLETSLDKVGNVIAEMPAQRGPRVLVAAHLDTVFSSDTVITIKEQENRLAAPGIGDNSASLAVLVHYVQNAFASPDQRPQLTIAATVGEEGLGDLYGMRELMKRRAPDFDYMIALDGHLGTVVHQSVGSKRFEVQLQAKGGHSWGDYPSPSAVHSLGSIIHTLTQLSVPEEPRSSFNIGQVRGGTSINAIAEEAQFNLDLRSLSADVLTSLEQEALKRIQNTARKLETHCTIKRVGDRPAAQSNNATLVQAARDALKSIGVTAQLAPGSTDANAAMAAGIPALAFGVYLGGDAHRLNEWLEPSSLLKGYRAFAKLLELLSQFDVSPTTA